jgi:hypothetical protein
MICAAIINVMSGEGIILWISTRIHDSILKRRTSEFPKDSNMMIRAASDTDFGRLKTQMS